MVASRSFPRVAALRFCLRARSSCCALGHMSDIIGKTYKQSQTVGKFDGTERWHRKRTARSAKAERAVETMAESGQGGVPDESGSECADAVERPVQRDRGEQAATATTEPCEDESGRGGGSDRAGDAEDLPHQPAAEDPGETAIALS